MHRLFLFDSVRCDCSAGGGQARPRSVGGTSEAVSHFGYGSALKDCVHKMEFSLFNRHGLVTFNLLHVSILSKVKHCK